MSVYISSLATIESLLETSSPKEGAASEKIKVGVWDHLAVSVSIYMSPLATIENLLETSSPKEGAVTFARESILLFLYDYQLS
jgi:hypothetical protein